jgi:hypothetical protein
MCWQCKYLCAIKQKGFFKDENNTPTNQKTEQELDQTRFTFVVTFVALGLWFLMNLLDKLVLD